MTSKEKYQLNSRQLRHYLRHGKFVSDLNNMLSCQREPNGHGVYFTYNGEPFAVVDPTAVRYIPTYFDAILERFAARTARKFIKARKLKLWRNMQRNIRTTWPVVDEWKKPKKRLTPAQLLDRQMREQMQQYVDIAQFDPGLVRMVARRPRIEFVTSSESSFGDIQTSDFWSSDVPF